MPMSNNNFKWRPNDNGSLTNMRYDLEATKWVKAVSNAESKLKKPTFTSMKGDLNTVGMFLTIPLILIFFILFIPIQVAKELFNYNIKIFPGDPPTGKILSEREKFDARLREIREKHGGPNPNRTIPDDMTEQQMIDLAAYVRAETAKAKKS